MLVTDVRFWDCECDDNYIKPKTQFLCLACLMTPDDCPDSREDELSIFYPTATRFPEDESNLVGVNFKIGVDTC